MDYSDVLASSIHDIKNSLSMLLSTLDDVLGDPDTRVADQNKANVLRFETSRVNSSLIQLLALYRMDKGELSPNLMEHNVDEFFEELVAENQVLMDSLGIRFSYACDPDLSGYFDDNLIQGVMGSAIGNAERYTKDQIRLSARSEDDYLVLGVEDNGKGFPDFMLKAGEELRRGSGSLSSGSTQLGLYFASKVARMHADKTRKGFMRLSNASDLGGARFELWLP